jgi:hypothetical protein
VSVDLDVDDDLDGDGDLNMVPTVDGANAQNILVSMATTLSRSRIARSYLSFGPELSA